MELIAMVLLFALGWLGHSLRHQSEKREQYRRGFKNGRAIRAVLDLPPKALPQAKGAR